MLWDHRGDLGVQWRSNQPLYIWMHNHSALEETRLE